MHIKGLKPWLLIHIIIHVDDMLCRGRCMRIYRVMTLLLPGSGQAHMKFIYIYNLTYYSCGTYNYRFKGKNVAIMQIE